MEDVTKLQCFVDINDASSYGAYPLDVNCSCWARHFERSLLCNRKCDADFCSIRFVNMDCGVMHHVVFVAGCHTLCCCSYVSRHRSECPTLFRSEPGSNATKEGSSGLQQVVSTALQLQGSLPWWLVSLIIGRDVVLLSGAVVHRLRTVGWRWPGAVEFFRFTPPPHTAQACTATDTHIHTASPVPQPSTRGSNVSSKGTTKTARQKPNISETAHAGMDDSIPSVSFVASVDKSKHDEDKQISGDRMFHSSHAPPVVFMQPLYISKVNTCFQLLLVGGCLTSSWYSWPPQEALHALGLVTGATTLASCAAYIVAYLKGTLK